MDTSKILFTMNLTFEQDVVLARQTARQIAVELKLSSQDQTRLATAVSEIARNAFLYGKGGQVTFFIDTATPPVLRIRIEDRGPGIANLHEILAGRYSSVTGMGVGIVGTKRLMDEFEIESSPGHGTVVSLGKTLTGRQERLSASELARIQTSLQKYAPGDALSEVRRQNREILLALEEVRQHKRTLEEQAIELKAARQAAETANASKSIFLANMSHEIRTPLGVILGFSDLLRDETLKPAERNQFLETIIRNGTELSQLIDDILDLSKVEAGKIELESRAFSLAELFVHVETSLALKAQDQGIALTIKATGVVPEFVVSDPTRLRQVLWNVIGNAIKFTSYGTVEVGVDAHPLPSGEKTAITIVVKDTGRGIASEQQALLFRAFSQADSSTTRTYGGTGLGLVLSKRLAKALGGDVELTHSVLGEGSTFTISVTVDNGKASVDQRAHELRKASAIVFHPQGRRLEGVAVLLVDDAADNRMLVERILTRQGASVAVAANGAEAVDQALGGTFDVILMDIQMPVLDGYGATRQLRSRGFTKRIIALTAHAMKEEKDRCFSSGCDDYLTKPIDHESLLSAVEHSIDRRQ